MNFTRTNAAVTTTKLQAMGSALLVTLAMLGSINNLATSEPTAALAAHIAKPAVTGELS